MLALLVGARLCKRSTVLVKLMVHNRGRAAGLLVALEMQLVLERTRFVTHTSRGSRGARSVTPTRIGGSLVSYWRAWHSLDEARAWRESQQGVDGAAC